MEDITVDPAGVAKLLAKLNIHKASGQDGLNARVLKECSSEVAPVLAYIFNESLVEGVVPDEWRQANVTPVFKKGEKYDAASHCSVCKNCDLSGKMLLSLSYKKNLLISHFVSPHSA